VVLEHGGGELVDPLPGGTADPAAVFAPGGGEWLGRDAAAEVVDGGDLRRDVSDHVAAAGDQDRLSPGVLTQGQAE
jgi:hypothetical protein